MTTTTKETDYSRSEAIAAIRTALKARSGKAWSVTGGTGTAYGWITIHAAPSRRGEFDRMSREDCAELGTLLGLGGPVHDQGVLVAASTAHRSEYVARAEGRTPSRIAEPYWD